MKYLVLVFLGGFVPCGVIFVRCRVIVDRYGVVVDRCGSFRVLVTTVLGDKIRRSSRSTTRCFRKLFFSLMEGFF